MSTEEIADELAKLRDVITGEDRDARDRIIQLIPAPGWLLWFFEAEADQWSPCPLVAWALTAGGQVRPVMYDGGVNASDVHSEDYCDPIAITAPGEPPPAPQLGREILATRASIKVSRAAVAEQKT